jgi:hypothetical protein
MYAVLKPLSDFAERTKAVPTVGYTHFQMRSLHRRTQSLPLAADLWLLSGRAVDSLSHDPLLGCRGATVPRRALSRSLQRF